MASRLSTLKKNRNWRNLWCGQVVSLLGDFVFDTTVLLWVGTQLVGGKSYAPLAVSGVLLAAAAPTVVVGPLAGVFVDRWNRKRTMMNSDLIRAALIALLMLLPATGQSLPIWLRLTVLYLVVAGAASVSQFFNPSRFAVIGAVLPPEDRAEAFSLSMASSSIVAVIGPPLAAPLLFSVGVEWALAVNTASFLVSYLLIRRTDIPAQEPEPAAAEGDEAAAATADGPAKSGFWAELLEGWRFMRGNTVLVVLALTVFIYMFGVGAINVLELFFVNENLHEAASWLGTLNGALGAGSILGALLAPMFVRKLGDYPVFGWGIVATAALVIVFARLTMLAPAVVVFGLVGIPLAVVNTVVGPIVLAETPNRLLGRINAVLNPLVYLASVSSMALAGVVASAMSKSFNWRLGGLHFHRIDTIFLVCGLFMLAAGITAVIKMKAAAEEQPAEVRGGRGEPVAVAATQEPEV